MAMAITLTSVLLTTLTAQGPIETCWTKAATPADRASCAKAEHARADRELNRAYAVALARGNHASRTALQEAETAWIAYRDAHVATVLADTASGDPPPSCLWIASERLTEARSAELAALVLDLSGQDLCSRRPGESSYADADRGLNETYRRILAGRKAEFGRVLRKAERAWIAYRDADTASLLGAAATSKSNRAACQEVVLARLTAARAGLLSRAFEQYRAEEACAVAESNASLHAAAQTGCEAGNPTECLTLGNAHAYGWFWLDVDPRLAVEPYRRACDAAVADACTMLASLYARGLGVGQDARRAAQLYTRACDLRDTVGCENLALAFVRGDGVPTDLTKARATWERACDVSKTEPREYLRGVPCRTLAFSLERGDPLPRDPQRALPFHEKACDSKQYASCLRAAQILREASLDEEDRRRMVSLYEAACRGYDTTQACVDLGDMYRLGEGIPQSVDKALALYKSACDASFLPGCRAARAITGEPAPGDPDNLITDRRYIMTVRDIIHPRRPALRLRFFGDDYGVVGRIEVFDEAKGAVTDRLEIPTEEGALPQRPFGGVPGVRLADLNFDGYQDLMLLDSWGATGNKGYLVWLFDPKTGRFALNRELGELPYLTPHPETRTLTTFAKGGHAAMICGGARYEWQAGHPVIVRSVSQDWDADAEGYVRVVEEFEGGTLVRRETHRSPFVEAKVEHFRNGRSLGVETMKDAAPEPGAGSPCWNP